MLGCSVWHVDTTTLVTYWIACCLLVYFTTGGMKPKFDEREGAVGGWIGEKSVERVEGLRFKGRWGSGLVESNATRVAVKSRTPEMFDDSEIPCAFLLGKVHFLKKHCVVFADGSGFH